MQQPLSHSSHELATRVRSDFRDRYGSDPEILAYAPGRVEVLGNHTDYNEGFVLSAAINMGTCIALSLRKDSKARIFAANKDDGTEIDVRESTAAAANHWSSYVIGVLAGMQAHTDCRTGFDALVAGDMPLGAGLSSSASLEVATALGLERLYATGLTKLDIARICQKAEHDYAGVQCGLLDQITSLYGEAHHLVMSDFRSLDIEPLPIDADACLLLCQTNVHHALVDGEYNERRRACEAAASYFSSVLDHPVTALRDVSPAEFEAARGGLDPLIARRAAHPVCENDRVLRGRDYLHAGDLERFGQLMFESHESSRENFENSCRELDFIVGEAKRIPGVLGARLSGGGFGGSAVLLTHPRDADAAGHALKTSYARTFGQACKTYVLAPSAGAHVIT